MKIPQTFPTRAFTTDELGWPVPVMIQAYTLSPGASIKTFKCTQDFQPFQCSASFLFATEHDAHVAMLANLNLGLKSCEDTIIDAETRRRVIEGLIATLLNVAPELKESR